MKRLALVLALLVAPGCTIENTLRARVGFQGPYDGFAGKSADAAAVALAAAWLRTGRADADVLAALQAGGYSLQAAQVALMYASLTLEAKEK
jgi:hypothetical protein